MPTRCIVREADEALSDRAGAGARELSRHRPDPRGGARQRAPTAIHPGYGFLSENAEFAEACAEAGIVFVGPPPAAIRAMGLKDARQGAVEQGRRAGRARLSRRTSRIAGASARRGRAQIGYPVLIKAVAGGGGKGMRRVDTAASSKTRLAGAQREAPAAFGDDRVLIEKYVRSPRHVEVQVFADRHGNVVHLFERDCSLQRRHQKVIEEAPAPGMSPKLRAAMGAGGGRRGAGGRLRRRRHRRVHRRRRDGLRPTASSSWR